MPVECDEVQALPSLGNIDPQSNGREGGRRRTGWRSKFVAEWDAAAFMAEEPGLGLACCEWLYTKEAAAVASDNWAIEVLPGEIDTELLPVHMALIRDMGMTLGEILDLDELAADCEAVAVERDARSKIASRATRTLAATMRLGVIKLTVPRSSSSPQRPQLLRLPPSWRKSSMTSSLSMVR